MATFTAELYQRGMFPRVVFTGANAPTTVERFPRGEAVHYREHAIGLGVPDEVILVEREARNTGENIAFTRKLLGDVGVEVRSAILVSRPYQQRRVYSTAKKLWPELEVVCASRPLSLDDYIENIGDVKRVVDMLVGDTQRVMVYPERGFAIPQQVPDEVEDAYQRLVDAGFTSRLIRGAGTGG
ncbi:YdcF family protein [Spirillospora sp. NPDC049652]